MDTSRVKIHLLKIIFKNNISNVSLSKSLEKVKKIIAENGTNTYYYVIVRGALVR